MAKFDPVFMSKSLYQMKVRRRPIVLSHAVNARCNLKCTFCNQWQNSGAVPDMPFEDVCRVIDMAADFGILMYNAWSAEPLLRKDLPEIMAYARSKGLGTMMITNGKLLKKRCGDLADVDYVSVSFDGPTACEKLRGISADEIIEGISCLKEQNTLRHPILINCVLSPMNLDEAEDVVRLARELDVKVAFEPVQQLSGTDDLTAGGLLFDQENGAQHRKFVSLIDRLIAMKAAGYPIIHSKTYLKRLRDDRPQIRCHIDQSILAIDHAGDLYNCRVHDRPLGNVLETSLSDVWDRTKSARKTMRENCGGCLFFGYLENNLLLNYNIESLFGYEWL